MAHNMRSHHTGYVRAALLGAMGGGVAVALATRAVPKVEPAMMQNMMARMGERGCCSGEIWQRMVAG